MIRHHNNKPYVKQYDKNGKLTNPIQGAYITDGLNRAARRTTIRSKELYPNNRKRTEGRKAHGKALVDNKRLNRIPA